jgi:hypothetical protein
LRRPFAAWLASLALILQLVASAAHTPQISSSADLAAAALSAAIGQQVLFCGGANNHAPRDHAPCCDDCALCHGSNCAAGVLPLRLASETAPARVVATRLNARDREHFAPPFFVAAARPRAPPVPV